MARKDKIVVPFSRMDFAIATILVQSGYLKSVEKEAVDRAREYTLPYPPSSPSMALFKDGKLVHFVERHQIEGNNAETISNHLKKVFEHFC